MGSVDLSSPLSNGQPGDVSPSLEEPPLKWFPEDRKSQWFKEHFEEAAGKVVDLALGDNIVLTGRRIADLGCGDGSIALGVATKAKPAVLTGFDTRPTDRKLLLELAQQEGACDELPSCLEFRTSDEKRIPAEDDSFDFVYSWSVFEHVANPGPLIKEVHRVLSPTGQFMIQIFPLYYSEHGSHLWEWYPPPHGFAQLMRREDELFAKVKADPGPDPEWAKACMWAYRTLNKITLDELQRALYYGGFRVSRLELITEAVHIPPEVAHYPLSSLGIAGVQLLAVPLP